MNAPPNDRHALERRIAELEAEVAAWRAEASAKAAYASSRAPAGSAQELALFQRLQSAIHRRAPFLVAAIAAESNLK